MKVTFEFETQARRAAGMTSTELQLEDGATLDECLRKLSKSLGDSFRQLLFDDENRARGTVLLFVNDQLRSNPAEVAIKDGDIVVIATPISGG